MVQDPPFILIIVLIFVVIIIIIVLWIHTLKKPPILPKIAAYAPAQPGMRCSVTPISSSVSIAPDAFEPQYCDQGLACISAGPQAGSYCRKAIGSSCTTIYECEPQAIMCTGVCSISPAGGINQPCLNNGLCNSGLQCVRPSGQQGGIPICKYNNGISSCSKGTDCVSGRCVQNYTGGTICLDHINLGQSCNITSTDIAPCGPEYSCVTSDNRSLRDDANVDRSMGRESSREAGVGSHCQPQNLPSTGVGAVCYYPSNGGGSPNSATCASGLQCAYDYTNGGLIPGKPYGLCTLNSQKWGGQCSDTVACASPTICNNGTCVVPLDNSDNSLINTCGDRTSYQCNLGFTCSNSMCLSQLNQTCTYNTDCQSGRCGTWALMNWKLSPKAQMGQGLGLWRNMVSISVAPQNGASLSVAQIVVSGSIYNTYALYYPGGGSGNFYIYNQNSDTSSVSTYRYNIIASGSVSIVRIKSVKITPLGKILVHSNINNTLASPIRPGNPLSGATTVHSYDRIFAFDLNPNTNGSVTTLTLGDRVGPYFNGSTQITNFDVYDIDDKNFRIALSQSSNSTLWISNLTTSSDVIVTINSCYSITTTMIIADWILTAPIVYLKYYTDANGQSSINNLIYLLKGSNVYTSVNQNYKYPLNPRNLIYGIGAVINTNNPISDLSLYYTTNTQFRYSNGDVDIQLPGYPSSISKYSVLTDPVPTTSLLAQGGIDLNLYTINQICS
jgi:hypothetical protein